ncbi:MAG TPA: F0F1 ATP synthase subunit A [Bacteroidales bacterium]|nr:F0F1 ATP synthase subunit A [Bacteroidales bacterium]MDI9552346.1 F0F1 ATP synthase subunit A [Bacteroidota bacterium]HNY52482.1 F0F1 ATP synthase subunit A [Bacteroidales bacterium]HOG56738.1 F0F1 ATP synthase subunit A [Bacteroidales bacterium]HPB13300.1 F0F1 ATP synthase subunit A [Bacteroidales bacterium]
MKRIYFTGLLFIFMTICGYSAPKQESNPAVQAEEEFDASSFILGHIADSHEWHILTKKNGEHVSLYLPVILYSKGSGLHVFSSKKFAHGQEYNGFRLEEEGELEGRIVKVKSDGTVDMENMPLDFSITKTVLGMMAAALIGLWLFLALARSYKKTGISHPKGIQGFLEPIVLFVRDDIAIPNIGEKKAHKFMPYLLSVFFFILINNLMGLIPFPPPFGANVTGNIAITMTLALFTFFMIQFNGSKTYWRHIFAAPGVPFWLLPIMIPVEIIGMLSKPFALMVRLFANITAGHIIVLSLIALIFIFNSLAMAPVSLIFVLFMDCLELLVAFLQAYVFTLLSALFIGIAVEDEHH